MNLRDLTSKGDIPNHKDFPETKRSKQHQLDAKRYKFIGKLPDHLQYIALCPDKNELYIAIGSHFDYNGIENLFWNDNF